ncbi:MAG: hypothetical protein IJG55_10845 [Synergistaceae bacterium]|nr:hypothetical protein [Synergistaceae bacterium]
MAYSRRKYSMHIKSLVHFDFPYFNEAYDGCRDEISGNIFTRAGNVEFAGREKPCDEIISGVPKFGYRCLYSQSNSDYISAVNTGQFDIKSGVDYELECFVRLSSSSSGNIITFMNGSAKILTLSLTQDNMINLNSSGINMLNLSGSSIFALNTWYHVKVRLGGEKVQIILNGNIIAEKEYSHGDLTVSEIRIGGFSGFIDEFIMRDSVTPDVVPEEPYQGTLDINLAGGFGTGALGDVTLTSKTNFNSHAAVSSVNGKVITLLSQNGGIFTSYSAGTEIMIHVSKSKTSDESDLGRYAFRTVTGSDQRGIITIDREVTEEFNLETCALNYEVQIITVPHYKSLTIKASSAGIRTNAYANGHGGIIAMRVLNNLHIEGQVTSNGGSGIIVTGLGQESPRDNVNICNAELIDRFIFRDSGGIFIACGGTLSSNEHGRIGSQWAGDSGPGTWDKVNGVIIENNGGSGYGGAARRSLIAVSNLPANYDGSDDDGSVGYGGSNSSGKAGSPGHNGSPKRGSSSEALRGRPGASVIIIARKLSLNEKTISTGGQNGTFQSVGGGGGTGFAYIACEEMN